MLLVLRPEPGAAATVAAARAMGLDAVAAPLFTVRAVDWAPPVELPDAVLMTSANAARLGGPGLAALSDRPLYAVGAATAEAARAAGFRHVVAGSNDVEAIVTQAHADGIGRLLHLAGREHRGLPMDRCIVYVADPVDVLPEAARTALPEAVALLHSPRAARLFATLVDPAAVRIAAISAAARDAAGPGWQATAVAEQPTDASLLAAAAKLCNTRPE
jgi:uroporphyrinogen-III synthase